MFILITKAWLCFAGLLVSADPYVHTIPNDLRSEYFDDLLTVTEKYFDKYSETGVPYTTSVIVASRPQTPNGTIKA